MRILIIEDESALRQRLATSFEEDGYVVDSAPDGTEGLYMGREFPVDVAVIDLGLPDMSGMEVIRTLRGEDRDFPVLILTARDRWQDKVEGLEAGADDYLAKPFHIEELKARVNALVRRSAGWATPVLEFGPWKLDTRSQQVTLDGGEIAVTGYEYRILEYLMLHAGEVVSKSELMEHLYPDDADRDSNVLEVLIGRLRKKIDPDQSRRPLETLRGRGYRFGTPRDT